MEKNGVESDKYGEGVKYVKFNGKIKTEKDDTVVTHFMDVREKEASNKGYVESEAVGVSKEIFAEELATEKKNFLAV